MEKARNYGLRLEATLAIKIMREIPTVCMLNKIRHGEGWLEFKSWRQQCSRFLGVPRSGTQDIQFESIIKKLLKKSFISIDSRHLTWLEEKHPGFYDNDLSDHEQWFHIDRGGHINLYHLNNAFNFKFQLMGDIHPKMDTYIREIYLDDRMVSQTNIMKFLEAA